MTGLIAFEAGVCTGEGIGDRRGGIGEASLITIFTCCFWWGGVSVCSPLDPSAPPEITNPPELSSDPVVSGVLCRETAKLSPDVAP